MSTTEGSILPNTEQSHGQITDVGRFFSKITEEYLKFQESVLHLDHSISVSSPEQILQGCELLHQKRNKLAILDQQMLDIITLAGTEIANTEIIHDYRVAFARASLACNNLSQNLRALKNSLEEQNSRNFSESHPLSNSRPIAA